MSKVILIGSWSLVVNHLIASVAIFQEQKRVPAGMEPFENDAKPSIFTLFRSLECSNLLSC